VQAKIGNSPPGLRLPGTFVTPLSPPHEDVENAAPHRFKIFSETTTQLSRSESDVLIQPPPPSFDIVGQVFFRHLDGLFDSASLLFFC